MKTLLFLLLPLMTYTQANLSILQGVQVNDEGYSEFIYGGGVDVEYQTNNLSFTLQATRIKLNYWDSWYEFGLASINKKFKFGLSVGRLTSTEANTLSYLTSLKLKPFTISTRVVVLLNPVIATNSSILLLFQITKKII